MSCSRPTWPSFEPGGRFSRDDFAALSEALSALKGLFILSINDTPEIRDLFAWAEIEPVETTYTVGGVKKARKAGELIISGGQAL